MSIDIPRKQADTAATKRIFCDKHSSKGYWPVDCAAAAQNMLLAAHALGLGAVWTGVFPRQQRIDGYRRLFGVPEGVMPHSLIVVGYAAEQRPAEDRYRADRVRRNRWS